MATLNLEILKLAREARCVTQNELADNIGIEQGTYSKIEKGFLPYSDDLIEKVSKVLDFPVSFFYQEKRVIPVEGHYRRKVSISVKQMKQYIAQMTIAEWHLVSMLDEIDLPDLNLPKWDILEDGSPQLCAKHVRDFWRIPKGRIANLTQYVENNGVVIIALDLGEMDGFSAFINGNIPVIFVNKNLPPDRYRLTVAHELGHLIMHFGNKVGADRDLETEAYQFAIELLVPENNIRPYLTKVTIEKLADLKGYWYVSMAALLKYSNSLGMVTGNQYRYLWMQIGSLGYKLKEPVAIPNERPGLINEMIVAYLNDYGYTKEQLASVFHLSVPEFEKMYVHTKLKLKAI